jgi:hypothetical protein
MARCNNGRIAMESKWCKFDSGRNIEPSPANNATRKRDPTPDAAGIPYKIGLMPVAITSCGRNSRMSLETRLA